MWHITIDYPPPTDPHDIWFDRARRRDGKYAYADIAVVNGRCDMCGQDAWVVGVDTGGSGVMPYFMCPACIARAIAEQQSKE